MKKKKIYLLSISHLKHKEYKSFFSNYDIDIILIDNFKDNDTNLFDQYNHLFDNAETIAIFREKTQLFNKKNNEIINRLDKSFDLAVVYTNTTLKIKTKSYEKSIKSGIIDGFIDYDKRNNKPDTFGWDDVFILDSLGLSYQDLKDKNMKNHCRQEVMSKFVASELHYEDKIELNYNKQNQKEVIEFSNSVANFITDNQFIQLDSVKKFGFHNLFRIAVNNGGFFRSSKNRRQKNYWMPGLNAGLPLVPKKDEIHELTFFIHDLCHFIMPDLIYTGHSDNHKYDQIYLIYRMMSESLTMVLADMCFIDCLQESNVDYNFDKRKIYPLYKAILNKDNKTSLKEILYANMKYCLFGDDTEYQKLISDSDFPILNEFKDKYEPFFIEDFKWTVKNLENMKSNSEMFLAWSSDNRNLIASQNLKTISDLNIQLNIDTNNSNDIANTIFDHVFISIIDQRHQAPIEESNTNLTNSFKKYMLGQNIIFHKFNFIPISKVYLDKINTYLDKQLLDINDIEKIRDLYSSYLSILESRYKLINADDLFTYKDVFPIFDSFFVFYDEEQLYYKNLKTVSYNILNNKEDKDNEIK